MLVQPPWSMVALPGRHRQLNQTESAGHQESCLLWDATPCGRVVGRSVLCTCGPGRCQDILVTRIRLGSSFSRLHGSAIHLRGLHCFGSCDLAPSAALLRALLEPLAWRFGSLILGSTSSHGHLQYDATPKKKVLGSGVWEQHT